MKITMFDRNQELCDEWRMVFEGIDNVDVVCCELSELKNHDVLVTAGNSFGVMTGGIDLAVRNEYGVEAQDAIQDKIMMDFACGLPVGATITVKFEERERFPYLVYAPTMIRPSNIHWFNVFQATLTALLAAGACETGESVISVAIPGMGTGVGAVAYPEAATAMRLAFDMAKTMTEASLVIKC